MSCSSLEEVWGHECTYRFAKWIPKEWNSELPPNQHGNPYETGEDTGRSNPWHGTTTLSESICPCRHPTTPVAYAARNTLKYAVYH
jgi:hypothetical protein